MIKNIFGVSNRARVIETLSVGLLTGTH